MGSPQADGDGVSLAYLNTRIGPSFAPTCYYTFLIAGQSNAADYSDGASQPVPPGFGYQYTGADFIALADPIGPAQGGHGGAWGAFANEFYRRTGCGVILVPTAKGSTALMAAADGGAGNWSASGSLRAASVAKLRACMGATTVPWQFGGILWDQGEQDAHWIATGAATQADYVAAFEDMLAYYRAQLGAAFPFIISRTGSRPDHGEDASWQQVRDAQDGRVRDHPGSVYLGWTGAATLLARGLMQPGSLHYKQAAYDEMGRHLAAVAASVSVGRM